MTSPVGNSFSPDKARILVSGDQEAVFNAYSVSIDEDHLAEATARPFETGDPLRD